MLDKLYKQSEIQGMAAFLEWLEEKTNSSQSTNYHAVQHVIIAILFICLSNNSAQCPSVLK
jgi:hypothetical protein